MSEEKSDLTHLEVEGLARSWLRMHATLAALKTKLADAEAEAREMRSQWSCASADRSRLEGELAVTEEALRLARMDSDNYRGQCDACGAACMDLLTDEQCAACQCSALAAEAARLRAACEKGGLHSEDLPTQLEWVAGRLVFRYGDDDKRDYIIALKDRAAALRAALRPAAAPGGTTDAH